MESKLAFDRIRDMLRSKCSNVLALRMVDEMSFMTDLQRIAEELDLTDEMRLVLLLENAFPSQDFIDLTDILLSLRVENTAIQQPDLLNLKVSLCAIRDIVRFFAADAHQHYTHLVGLASGVELIPAIYKDLERIIDDRGEIFDNASDKLLDIRRQILRKSGEVDAQINRSLARAKREGWAPDNAEPTIRNGRPVIPMLDTHRRKMKGIIQDESATRLTAFVEPAEVVELNNDLRQLSFDERHEIQRIILHFCDTLRPHLSQLLDAYHFLARIDFLRAKARLAIALHAVRPLLVNHTAINWIDACHPLLWTKRSSISGQSAPVVPFSLTLDGDRRILVVSGPNAGGKSVLLKAVGLIQYMLQCGLLVPCRETSEFGIFDRIFIDIGDQQSIDNDLSTYTSHLQNMKQLLNVADAHTLFLLDELGGGTEPRSGCAIAEALLEILIQRGSFGVVTTHFADLKLLPDRHPEVINGAMLFDLATLRPRYQLSLGTPGSSFAFEIASTIGLPQELLDAAGGKVGTQMLNFEHQIQQIETDKKEIERQRAELQVADNFFAEVTQKYQNLTQKLETQRHQILSQARSEARQIIADANRTVEQTISDIKRANAEKEQTQQARQRMRLEAERLATAQERHDDELRHKVAASPIETDLSKPPHSSDDDYSDKPVVVGSVVRIDGNDTYGQVVVIKAKKAVVESNSIRMTIPLSRLTATTKKTLPSDRNQQKNNRFQSIYDDLNEKRKHFNPTLDLRGQRADEALDNLQHFLDEALLLSEKQLRILHGKGYGILKQLVRDQLQSNPEVLSFRSEMLELGGDGITVVQLR